MALLVMLGWLLGTELIAVINVFGGLYGPAPGGVAMAGYVVCLVVVFGTQMAHSVLAPRSWPPGTRALTLTVQGAATYVPVLWVGLQAFALVPLLAGSCLLAVPGRLGRALFLAIGGTVPLGYARYEAGLLALAYGFAFALLSGLVAYGLSSLGALVTAARAARGDLAQMAVHRQRLQIARDMHDLIGHHLSALTLKCELVFRLLPAYHAQALAELEGARRIADRAKDEIRSVVEGYSHLSFEAEVESVSSTLVSAEIEARPEVSLPSLPPELETVLAIALREAVTNVLRHSKAQRCVIQAGEHDGPDGRTVRVLVANDGVGAVPATLRRGHGLDNLMSRLRGVGGELTVRTDVEEGWFHLIAEVPLRREAVARQPPREDHPGGPPLLRLWYDRSWRAGLTAGWRPAPAFLLLSVVLIGYTSVILINVLALPMSGLARAGAVMCVLAVFLQQGIHSLGWPGRWPAWLRLTGLGVQALTTFAPLLWVGRPWGSMAGFLAGSVLLLLSRPWRWPAYAGLGAVLLALTWPLPNALMGYLTLSSLVTGLVVYGMSKLAALVADADAKQAELAEAAVGVERLRLARDLRNVVDNNLTAIVLKTELVRRLLPHAPGRARDQMALVLETARRALADIRTMVSGYRNMSLTTEIRSAEAMLIAAGISVETDVAVGELPKGPDALLALVLREAVTNVLRHSSARRCRIEVTGDERTLRLDMRDDEVAGERLSPRFSGLNDLEARLASTGGRLTIAADDGWYRLTAEVPSSMEAPEP
ncbi:sensor histidine kinase [Thermoactinospora rubra]|uniref:sensor histidine kinase n=1 Tax=Thermoactinospora rubra TaxID=1088767 RepID=UPI000A11D820|nr:histidine kinase [Thermoactinospora rubra]